MSGFQHALLNTVKVFLSDSAGYALMSLVIATATVWLYIQQNRMTRTQAIKEATDQVFQTWWSSNLSDMRHYFFTVFIPTYRQQLNGKAVRDLNSVLQPPDRELVVGICNFFDRVGWLCAAKLIDADYVLGPMQHVVRQVWFVMEPLILEQRKPAPGKMIDPIFNGGFEWLFRRSDLKHKHQAQILHRQFTHPALFPRRAQVLKLQHEIDLRERTFKEMLASLDISFGPSIS